MAFPDTVSAGKGVVVGASLAGPSIVIEPSVVATTSPLGAPSDDTFPSIPASEDPTTPPSELAPSTLLSIPGTPVSSPTPALLLLLLHATDMAPQARKQQAMEPFMTHAHLRRPKGNRWVLPLAK
jgi:hypothetical protein